MPRKATREAGPAAINMFDDDPTRDELIEALGNLRVESDKVFDEWQRAVSMRHRETASRAWTRWERLHAHIDNLCEGVDLIDIITH